MAAMSQPIDKSLHLRTASEHPDSQQIQLRAAIHFPLDQLQSVDVALGAAVAPRHANCGGYLLPIPDQAFSKSIHLLC
jgi:hypothetical protein